MELVKNKLSTTILKTSKYSQFTINDDFNVPDAKDDMERIIASTGNVLLDDVETLENKVRISGTVVFKVLYQTVGEDVRFETYEGDVPFEESINMDGILAGDKVDVSCVLEDLYITMINSRKFEVRGLVGMKLWAMDSVELSGATGLLNGSGIECRNEQIPFTNNVASVKDILKVKEDFEIAANKPNIGRVLWSRVSFYGIETKVVDGGINMKGQMDLFVIYLAEEPGVPMQYLNESREFEGLIPCEEANEGMILDDRITMGKGEVSVRADNDGEDRVLQVEYNLHTDMKIYEDMELSIIGDMFSPSANVETICEQFPFEDLQIKNNAKTKVVHKERIKSSFPKILQIVYATGTVEIDEVKAGEDSIDISGAVKAEILYVSAEDSKPLQQIETAIPFNYQVESVPFVNQDSIRINPSVDQITAQMLNSDEVEIKAVINMNVTVFAPGSVDVITDMNILPIDWNKKAAMPGMVGYVVKEGDSIWSIAKEYFSSLDSIRTINHLESDEVTPGEKLLIVKC